MKIEKIFSHEFDVNLEWKWMKRISDMINDEISFKMLKINLSVVTE